MEQKKIAVATNTGVDVDVHFGHAQSFHIYSVEEKSLKLETVKTVTPLSDGDKTHTFNPEKLDNIASALMGCSFIYCTKVGERPLEEMRKRGFEIVEFEGGIKDIAAL